MIHLINCTLKLSFCTNKIPPPIWTYFSNISTDTNKSS